MTGNEWRVGWCRRGPRRGDCAVIDDLDTLVAEVKTGQADDAWHDDDEDDEDDEWDDEDDES